MATTLNSRLDTFKKFIPDVKKATEFADLFEQQEGQWKKMTDVLIKNNNWKTEVARFDYINQLADWSDDHYEVIKKFEGNPQTPTLRAIALNTSTVDLESLVEKTDAPSSITGKTPAEKKANYVLLLNSRLFSKEPTAVLQRLVKPDNDTLISDPKLRGQISSFLTKQAADFNIKTTSVYEAFKKADAFVGLNPTEQTTVKETLKNLQRLTTISPTGDAVSVLMKANIRNGYQISEMSETQFVQSFKGKLGLSSEAQFRQIHKNATDVRIRNEHALMSLKEAGQKTGIAFIDKSLAVIPTRPVNSNNSIAKNPNYALAKETAEKHNLSWDTLFSDANYCECGECTSVYSAAAYFVELMQYLRNNNLDPNPANDGSIKIKTDLKDISGTPLEKLLARRPDLGCLELTCENTNTILPYVDLVNEVMESYVVHKKEEVSKRIIPYNTTDETSGELLAQPQHTEYKAYETLQKEVYPFTLPYHQPIDAARIYLDFLKTSRTELIETFSVDNLTSSNAVDAEFLGLTEEEYLILTKKNFASNAIGLKQIQEYYGYPKDTEGDMKDTNEITQKGLKFIKKQFLPRTGIQYLDLVELLRTESLNPNAPKGKSKFIAENLQFSYQFLKNFKTANGEDKLITLLTDPAKLVELVPTLKDFTQYFDFPKADATPLCPPVSEKMISQEDITNWVKTDFERIGKMLVLNTPRQSFCQAGVFLSNTKKEFDTIEGVDVGLVKIRLTSACKILMERQNPPNPFLRISIIGEYDCESGIITLTTNKPSLISLIRSRPTFKTEGSEPLEGLWSNERLVRADDKKKTFGFVLPDNCDIDKITLKHLDGTEVTVEEYDSMHRFIRLWRKLGWTIEEVDTALSGLGSVITPKFLHQLVSIKKLMDKTGLELTKLLTFWSNISTSGEKSLYKRLFLTHNLVHFDPVFKAKVTGDYLTEDEKISDHKPVIMAAFNLSSDDIDAIILATSMPDELTLANISKMYRYRLLAKVLGLRVPAFIDGLLLFGDPFVDADTTLQFMESWAKMEDAGFNYRQLNYIIKGHDDSKKPLSPSEKTILVLAKTFYDGLNAIDEAHKDLVDNLATIELVKSKAALLFDPSVVEQILGILEGTSVFSTYAPYYLKIEIDEQSTLKSKLKYSTPPKPTLENPEPPVKKASIQIRGILTETEKIAFKALSNDAGWEEALNRIENKQKKLFKAVLPNVFEAEAAIIKEGDVNIPLEKAEQKIKEDPTLTIEQILNSNTSPNKRLAFLKVYLPYLRQELTHRFVVETLSNAVGLERSITDTLISEILGNSTPFSPIYNVFEKVKYSTKAGANTWEGFLIPTTDGDYTFIVKGVNPVPKIGIDDGAEELVFTEQGEVETEWWANKPIKLQAGQLYKFSLVGSDLKNVFWKTATSSITVLPPSVFLPNFASDDIKSAFVSLKKAALLVSGFNLGADELRYFKIHKSDFGGLDFDFSNQKFTPEHWLRLEAYTRLRNSLPQTKINILDFWKAQTTPSLLSSQIAELTLWSKERVEKLIKAEHFNLDNVAKFKNEENLLKLQHALSVADKIGMDIDKLFDWAISTSDFDKTRKIADGIEKSIRSQYKQTDWEQVVKPLSDKLRNNQKEALIAYLLQQPELQTWGVTDADGLFEYFLIDVQMDACMETSRIKQAISSIQLFVQRCFLGLESKKDNANKEIGVGNQVLDRGRWDWMQRYRVWEANRKVFLYPENWIESNLRDDKSPFFQELESELLQKDINKQNVTDALKAYLYKVDEVANMEVIGLHIEMLIDKDGNTTNTPAKLHVFSRTRNAPYFFYYRYFDILEKNWYAWEKMQVDIPSYDVENTEGVVTGNGCYLTPVVWNGRLLIFFPQIMKKVKPTPNPQSIQTTRIKDEHDVETSSTSTTIPNNKPIEYWEIKMAWSEYRTGKWTQKQLSSDAWSINNIENIELPNRAINKFVFVPKIYEKSILILLDDRVIDDTDVTGAFSFDGNNLRKNTLEKIPSEISKEFGVETGFQYFIRAVSRKIPKNIQSMQVQDNVWGNDDAAFTDENSNVLFEYAKSGISRLNFYHPFTSELLGNINLGQLEDFFKFNTEGEMTSQKADAFGAFDNDNNVVTPNIYHELKRPYSLYNWELFFHTPMMLADALSKAQQFEEAMKWYHFVFSPITEGDNDKRFWQFMPFKDMDSQSILDNIFNNLPAGKADKTINEWRNHPFMPHLVARSRPVAYMKWVVMKYIDNILAWGDYLFRQDTIESINQATQLYVLAGHILGERPMMIPKRGKIKPQTYLNLLDKWDAFGNAMVEMELIAPASNQTPAPVGAANGVVGTANVFGFATSLYFCLPNNPKLMGYWDTVSDRLFKIRHCQNIEGIFRKLPLFEPPIDPALLVKAAAQGLSIASVLNDLNTPMPNYRFYYLLQKALELCSELKSLGGALLSAIEKKDNETITLMRAKHESTMNNLVMEVRKLQVAEAEKSLDTLQQNRLVAEHRMKYYLQLIGEDVGKVPSVESDFSEIANAIETPVDGNVLFFDGGSELKLNKYERNDLRMASASLISQVAAGQLQALSQIFFALPDSEFYAAPFGTGMTIKLGGGEKLGMVTSSVAGFLQNVASVASYQSAQSGKKGNFSRALQDRIFQANAAGYEIKQIDKQITAQQIRISMANLDISNQQKQIDNAHEVEEFLKSKFSNEELYVWMRDNLKTLYHQVYSLAYDISKKAEKVFRFERGLSTSNFIQSGYWEDGYSGLLAGERLFVSLKQLEAAYQENRGYDYEITKHISLRQINPMAVLQLKETGKCEFMLPEVLFDMDFPGHYKRRIKSVSISIPCVAGPYTNINASLRLMENKFRNSAIAKNAADYLEKTEDTDERFSTYIIPISAIAASSAQNESGMFELNFKDERYLPFEGAGVTSKWRLELPDFRQFDYDTISDVVVHLRYISTEGGERLKSAALSSVTNFMKQVDELGQQEGLFSIIDLQHDLPTEWHKASNFKDPNDPTKPKVMDLSKVEQFIPFYATANKKATDIVLATNIKEASFSLLGNNFGKGVKVGELDTFTLILPEQNSDMKNWTLTLPDTAKKENKVWMMIRFTMK